MARPSGISPPSDGRSRSSPDSFSDPELLADSRALVPAASTIVRSGNRPPPQNPRTPLRLRVAEDSSSSGATPVPQRRAPELSATQATFLAGAAMQTAHHASGVALHAANAAHNAAGREQLAQQAAAAAAEREHLVTQQAREVIKQMSVHTAQNEEVLRAQAHAIASAAQSALSDAQVREESLRAQAQQALQQADAMAHRQLAEARAEVSRVEAARTQAEGAWHGAEDARQRAERRSQELQLQVDTADTRTCDLESQVAALKRELASTQADALARVQALTGQLLHAREQGFEVSPPTPALVSSPTIPEDAPFVFTQPSPDQSPNGTVSFPQQSTLSVPAGMGFQTAPSDAQPSDQHAPSEGAACGVPVHVAQFASPVNPPVDNALERRVDDLASLVKNLAGLVAKGFAAHPGEQPAQGAASQGAPATQSGAAPSAAVAVPTLSLGATKQQAGGNRHLSPQDPRAPVHLPLPPPHAKADATAACAVAQATTKPTVLT